MIIALNIAFWSWCALLMLLAVLFYRSARASSGDATGGLPDMMAVIACGVLLTASLLVRGLVWWLL